jgi:tight adherence protein C
MGGAVVISLAMAAGAIWIGLDVRRQEQRSAVRAGQVVSGGQLAPAMELQAPFVERVVQPALRRLLQVVGGLSPGRNIERLRRQLLIAGSPLGLGPLDFIGLRLIATLLGVLGVTVLLLQLAAPLFQSLLIGVTGALLCAQLPKLWLSSRMRKRRKAVMLALPDALDMLTVCVDAGLGLEGAFQRIGESWDHALAYEFRRALVEIGMGISWREAMRSIVYRTDVRDLSSFVAVLVQAEQLGFSIADTLHTQAEQLRIRRRQRAQEQARAAPFKMLFPMVFFILPALFAVILGPAIPAIMEALAIR